MRRFLLRRGAMLVVSLLVSSLVIYSSVYIAPGNPISVLSGGRALPRQSVLALEARYHLNRPFFTQYWDWLTGVLHGNLGYSIIQRENVSTLIGPRIATTTELVLYAAVIIVVAGIALGVLGALRPGMVDTSTLLATTFLAATPSFVAAIGLVTIFAVNLRWFPALGNGTGFADQIYHLTLPAIALAVSSLALVARITRAAVREELEKEHVQTAVARGIPRRQLLRRHVLRNAAIPITTVTGVTIASLIAVAAVVETAFNLNGLGSYLVSSASSKDFAVVQAISLLLVAAFIVTNAFVDLLYAVLDPRVTLGRAAS
ncbi:MAG: ABC transporter permease [Streptosporangiaceae bacterium]